MTGSTEDKAQAFAEHCVAAGMEPPIPGLPAEGCACHYRIVTVKLADGTDSPRPGPIVECEPCSAVRLAHQRATCDHLVAIDEDRDYVHASGRAEAAASALVSIQRWLERGLGIPSIVSEARTMDTPDKALRFTADLFDYCPRCGARNVHP